MSEFCSICGTNMNLHDKRYSTCIIKPKHRHNEKNCGYCEDEKMRRLTVDL